jgi:hypothetical protein
MDRQRVHAAREFTGKCCIDHAMTFEAALSAKRFRHNIETKVSLTAGAVSGMAFVAVRLVLDVKALGRESLLQLFDDEIARLHGCHLARIAGRRNP